MKQLKILVADYGHKVGDVVEYKRYGELSADEKDVSTMMPDVWDDADIFVPDKSASGKDENCWGYMYNVEVEIIEL